MAKNTPKKKEDARTSSALTRANSTPMIQPSQDQGIPDGGQFAATIPTAQKERRNRPWDNRNKHLLQTYRGIPPELHSWFVDIAKENAVPVGEVVRFAMEEFKTAVEANDIQLTPAPKVGRMSLYPEDNDAE